MMSSAQSQLELLRNFEAYSSRWWSLQSKSGEWVSFNMFRTQRLCNEMYERQMDTRGFVRMNVLKSRQGGITTWATARGTHHAMTRGVTCLTLAHEEKLPQVWLARCRMWRDQTPDAVRPHIGSTRQSELSFDQLPSRYYVGSAAGGFPGMGDTISWVHLSECGSWDKPPVSVQPGKVLHDLSPAMPTGSDRPGTVQIYESCGKIKGDWWYRHYQEAKNKDSDFENLFLPWFLQDTYRLDENVGEILSLDKYEQDIVRFAKLEYGLDLDYAQLAWRRHDLREAPYYGNLEEWACRYPSFEDEAFIAPGVSLYLPEMIRKADSTVRKPIWVGNIVTPGHPKDSEFLEIPSGELEIWEWAKPEYHYLLGADCQWGTKDTADFDVLHVECIETGKLAAKVKGRYPWNEWARKLAAIGFHYNTCPVAPERNAKASDGLFPILLGLVADWSYPNIWIRTVEGRLLGVGDAKDYGWWTDQHTKHLLVAYSQSATMDGSMQWADKTAVEQMSTIIKDKNLNPSAPVGLHDDDWMSRIITAYVAHQHRGNLLANDELHPERYFMSDADLGMLEWIEEMENEDDTEDDGDLLIPKSRSV